MVAPKGKADVICATRVGRDAQPRRNVGVGNFKLYPDKEMGRVASSSKKKSLPLKAESLTTGDSKESMKIVEKINNKPKSSANQVVQRKPLADVSNVHHNMLRISVGPGSRTMGLPSRKPSMVKAINDPSQKIADFHAVKRGVKDSRVSLEYEKNNTKNSGREYVVKSGRSDARNSLVPTRKSLPVLKRLSQTATNHSREADESSQKINRIRGFPVKSQVTKKSVSQINNRSHLRGNRASDGFIMVDRSHVDPQALSRKSVRPTVQTTVKGSNVSRISRLKCISSRNKVTASGTILAKKKEDTVISSATNVAVSHGTTQGETSTDGNNLTLKAKPSVNARGKSNRRRSYTSLLMSRSKLFGENGEVEEKLQCIDDNCNQLEVAEYVDEIYQYYWVLEAQNASLANYMSIQSDITPQMRGILVNWLVEVHFKFELMQETLYLTVTLLDRYLSQVQIKKNKLQLVGLTALLLASKYEDFWHPRVKDLISISAESYTRCQMLSMEKLFLKNLKFRLNEPTPYVFMLRFIKAAQSDVKLEHMAFYLIELCLVEYEALQFKPSLLCASALYVARSTLQITPAWTPLLVKHARYDVSQIRGCAEMILKFHKAARRAQLKVTFEKYTSPDLSRVAEINPLDKLPL